MESKVIRARKENLELQELHRLWNQAVVTSVRLDPVGLPDQTEPQDPQGKKKFFTIFSLFVSFLCSFLVRPVNPERQEKMENLEKMEPLEHKVFVK